MEFWAIAGVFQEEIFWDFKAEDDTSVLTEVCFLPTKDMAERYIGEYLDSAYIPVKVTLEILEESGVWSYTREPVVRWGE